MIDCIASEPREVLHGMRPRGPWLKVSDAADILGVAPVTLWKWRRAGMIDEVRTRKEGAFTYYHDADIHALARRLASEDVGDYDRDLVRDAKQREREEEASAKRIAKQRDREEAKARGIKDQKPKE